MHSQSGNLAKWFSIFLNYGFVLTKHLLTMKLDTCIWSVPIILNKVTDVAVFWSATWDQPEVNLSL